MTDDAITHGVMLIIAFALLGLRIWLTMEDGWIPILPQSKKIQTLFGSDEKR